MSNTYIFRFPFESIKTGATVVIYGAGRTGDDYVRQIQHTKHCDILYVADENYKQINQFHGVNVCSPERMADVDEYDYVVISSLWCAFEMNLYLDRLGIPKDKVICTFRYGLKPNTLCGEDLITYTILKLLGKDKFSYIDLGVNDPYKGNNTAYLYAHGCRGICIEADPDFILMIKNNRPEDIVLNVGVAAAPGVLTYYSFEDSAFNTFSQRASQSRLEEGHNLIKTLEIPVMTLTEIINTYSNGIYPDFLDIDIEDMDYDVLCSCDFSSSSPMVLCVEVDSNGGKKMSEMLDAKGFVPFHRTWRNVIYLRKDLYYKK